MPEMPAPTPPPPRPSTSTRPPRLIPHTFTIRQAKRKYHAQRSARTWWQWCQEHRGWLVVAAACVGVAVVLYVRYWERRRRLAQMGRQEGGVFSSSVGL